MCVCVCACVCVCVYTHIYIYIHTCPYIIFSYISCAGVAETVMSLLIDMEAFYQYDNRESLIAQASHSSTDEHA